MRLRKLARPFVTPMLATILLVCTFDDANAIQMDWNGQFWFDNHWLNNYQLDRGRPGYDNDPLYDNGGPYVPGAGEKNVVWYSAFLKLNPRLVVNDNIHVKSEWHVGSPIYGFFGRGYPNTGDERYNFTGSQKDNFTISAQRVWANLITDFGTVELGRAPIQWGLGAIWDAGDDLFERYQSTGDMVRLTAKFGNFSVQPALTKVAMGNNVAGASSPTGATLEGNDDVTDYNLAVKYDNSEEDFEFGMMWTKRTGNTAQKSIYFNRAEAGSTRINFNIFDFYTRKKWSRFSLGAELPLFTGDIGAVDQASAIEYQYNTYALVVEGGYNSDLWDIKLRLGHVPGQPGTGTGDDKFRAVYLNKNYGLGLIMFHYNLYGLAQNNPDTTGNASLNSPYDNQIVNANYLALTPELKLDKWTLRGALVAAFADEVAQAGRRLYAYHKRRFYNSNGDQSRFMGWEADIGTSFRWDENFILSWDLGFFFPGSYYEFSNFANNSRLNTSMMFASRVQAGITF